MSNEVRFNIIEIEINTACNLSCSYCPNSISTKLINKEMKPETFELLLGQLKELNYKGLVYYHMYGEPLLNKNLTHFVRLTKTYLPESRPAIFSNGLLLTKEKLNALLLAGAEYFVITKQEKVDNSNFQNIYDLLSNDIKSKILLQDYTELKLSTRGGAIDVSEKKTLPLILPCLIPKNRVIITYNGDILPCFEDYYRKHVMGNIHESTIKEIWQTSHYTNFRNSLSTKGSRANNDICSKCNNRLLR